MTPEPFVKKHGAQSADDYESWERAETARTLVGHQGTPAAIVVQPEVPPETFVDVHPTLTKVVQSFEMMGGALVDQPALTPVAGSPRDGYEETETAAPLMASFGKSGAAKVGTRNQAETLVAVDEEPLVVDTYNHAEVEGGVTNTLTKSSSAVAVAGAGDPADELPDVAERDPKPDGRRYAACGDGVAAPVAHWIGLRLLAVMRGENPDG